MDGLIFAARGVETSPAVCCQRANMLEQTSFQDGYKHLNYQEVSVSGPGIDLTFDHERYRLLGGIAILCDHPPWTDITRTRYTCLKQVLYSEFLRALREKPKLLATCLTSGDRLNLAETADVLSAVFSGIYGSCLMPDDEQLVLQLLHDLMRLQLTSAANPRDDIHVLCWRDQCVRQSTPLCH